MGGIGGVLYGAWEEAVATATRPTTPTLIANPSDPRKNAGNIVEPLFSARCRSQHETWSEGEDDRDASIIKRRNCRWVGVGGNRGFLPGSDTLGVRERTLVPHIHSITTSADSHPRVDRKVASLESPPVG